MLSIKFVPGINFCGTTMFIVYHIMAMIKFGGESHKLMQIIRVFSNHEHALLTHQCTFGHKIAQVSIS